MVSGVSIRITAALGGPLMVLPPEGRTLADGPYCAPVEPLEELTNAQQIVRQFNAKGEHTCSQSRTAIGHRCEDRGQFMSCADASLSLKLQDCCGETGDGGRSIGFILAACSQYKFPKQASDRGADRVR